MNDQSQEILIVFDVMGRLLIGKNQAYALLNSGELKGFRIGRVWKVPKKCLDDYISSKVAC